VLYDSPAFQAVLALLRSGRFREAHLLLMSHRGELQRHAGIATDALTAELSLEIGNLVAARNLAERLLGNTEVAEARVVAYRVLAEVNASQLNFEDSLASYRSARDAYRAGVSATCIATVELSFFGWFGGVLPLENVASEFAGVRRAVIRSGSPQRFAELHLCAGRLEARKGGTIEAQRHWRCAHDLLQREPSLKIQAQLQLDRCMFALLKADYPDALSRLDEAAAIADDAGYFRRALGALIDRAHILLLVGQFAEARVLAETAIARSEGHHQLQVAALDCLANVLLAANDVAGAEAAFDRILEVRPVRGSRLAPHWDVLSELSSRLSLARTKGAHEEANALLAEGLKTAVASKDKLWLAKMQLALAEFRLSSNDVIGAIDPLIDATGFDRPSPELIARTAAVKGLAALRSGQRSVAAASLSRGSRIAIAIESTELVGELRALGDPIHESPEGAPFDDAIALLELAGYPHVLAREAYALLDLAGAADAQALVARSDAGARVVAARGWSDAEAAAIAADPGDRCRIVCGVHRDETWEIVADLKPSLTDRCAAIGIRKLVDTAVTLDRYRRDEKQRAALWPADTLETDGGLWVSEQMTELLSVARRVATADVTVLLTGETGTGKEVLARAIHRASTRAAKPFVPFNCTAVPREMLESQLFGYRKGAFTGADQAFDGVIRAAAGGTLFLDEIAEIGSDLQPKLLRFLETREIHGLGEPQPVKVDVRIIAATNADLESAVSQNRFREDLFYRLNVVRLRLPPLRERREEIPPLIEHYLRKFTDEQKKGRLVLDDETLEYLVLYAWPGNVRQLVNEINRVVAYADPDGAITPALLSPEIQASRRTVRVLPGDEPEIRVRLDQPLNDAIDAIERVMVLRALDRAGGNYENAAKLLGISRKGLFLKRRRWGLRRDARAS
jgi:DNA-binding NtrC family response regulator/tetratricopeptide (TPR) repeat protein